MSPDTGPDRLGLTRREQEVLRLAAAGRTNPEIADHLGVAQNTVKTYMQRAFEKTGTKNRIQACVRAGLLTPWGDLGTHLAHNSDSLFAEGDMIVLRRPSPDGGSVLSRVHLGCYRTSTSTDGGAMCMTCASALITDVEEPEPASSGGPGVVL